MRRISTVLLPQFPLQLALRKRNDWRGAPVAVVDDPGPNGRLLHINTIARQTGLHVGMRHAVARDLVPTLHTTLVSVSDMKQTIENLTTSLQTFSPRVECNEEHVGAFTIDPEGLHTLYGGYVNWTKSVYSYLKARGWYASVGVAFHRSRCLAIARKKRGHWVIPTPQQELELSNDISLYTLGLNGSICEDLSLLGIDKLGDFLSLSQSEIHRRFGEKASHFYALFDQNEQLPIQPSAFDEPVRVSFQLDSPDSDLQRLLFSIKGALHSLLHQVSARGESLSLLQLDFHIERAGVHCEKIEPSEATRDLMSLLELIRLRLGEKKLKGDVEEVVLTAQTELHRLDQQNLLKDNKARDMNAAKAALAKVRAAYGDSAVTHASLADAHLPEARFRWSDSHNKRTRVQPKSAMQPLPQLIRRVYSKPKPLPSKSTRSPEKGPWLKGRDIEKMHGPYRISGGWWKRQVERDYYYAQTDHGDLLWLFYDHPRKRWFLHGVVD